MKKIWQRMLSLLLALFMLPVLVPAELAAVLPLTTAYAADPVTISSEAEWKAFAKSGPETGTVVLGADITLTGEIPSKANFSGTLDGQGHTITLANGSVFRPTASNQAQIGLFGTLNSGGKVENLIIRVDGMVNGTSLTSMKISAGNETDKAAIHIGVLAGLTNENSEIRRVAVMAGPTGGTFRAVVNRWQTQDANVGGLCGGSNGGIVDQCYVGINVQGWRMVDSGNEAKLRTAGLIGYTNNNSITNCIVTSCEIRNYHSNPDWQENSIGQAAALVGEITSNTMIDNCVMDGVTVYSHDIAETTAPENTPVDGFQLNSNNRGTTGLAYARSGSSVFVTRCFAYNGTTMKNGGLFTPDHTTTGQNALSEAEQTLVGDGTTWLIESNGRLGLSWMYQVPQITMEHDDNNRDVKVTVSQKEPITVRSGQTTWEYTLQASLQGKNATPAAPTAEKGYVPSVASVDIRESRTTGNDIEPGSQTYYSGGSYQFYAKVTGTNLTAENTPVSWELVNVPMNGGTPAASIDAAGKLTVAEEYFGDLTLKATASGKSDTSTITIRPANLTILTPASVSSVQQGGSVDFGVRIQRYFTGSGTDAIEWTVSATGGSVKDGTKIDDNGVLTVDPAEPAGTTLTISATLSVQGVKPGEETLVPTAQTTIQVAAFATPESAKRDVTPTAAGEKVQASLVPGQQLELTLKQSREPAAPEGCTGKPTIQTTYTCAESNILTDSGSPSGKKIYTAAQAGAATVRVAQDFTFSKTEGGGTETVTWTSEVAVTVNDLPVPSAADEQVTMQSVAGTRNTAQLDTTSSAAYRLEFPAGDANRQYQLTITADSAEPAPSGGWQSLGADASTVTLNAQQVKALQEGKLCLWMRQTGAGDLAASSVAGYNVTEASGSLYLAALDDYPADGGLEPKSNIVVTGQWTVNNGQVEGQPTSVLKLLAQADPSLVGYTSLDTGEVSITVRQASGTYQNKGTDLIVETTQSVAVGDAVLKPTIQPNANGQLTGNCFTIDVPDQENVAVYYQIYTNTSTVSPLDYPSADNGGILYTKGTQIPYPQGNYKMVTVVAMAYPTDDSGKLPSNADIVTYTQSNLIAPDPPELQIGSDGSAYVGSHLYAEGEVFRFVYDATSAGDQGKPYELYYTTNGSDPVAGSDSRRYDPENPPTLQFNLSSELVIKAIVYDPSYGVQSSVASFTVQRLGDAGKLTASVSSGSQVRPGQQVALELSQEFVSNLPELANFVSVQYAEYTADSPVFAAYESYTVAENSDTPTEGVRYLVVDSGTSVSSSELPNIRYLLNDETGVLSDVGTQYRYAVCQVWTTTDTQDQVTHHIRYTNPDPILLEGASGDKLTLRAAALAPSSVTSYLDGAETTFTYTIRGTVATPQSVPQTDAQGSTAVDIGERIALIGAADTEIYYTTDGTQPQVVWVEAATPETASGGHWEPASESTIRYAENLQVPNTDSKLFILNAIAVSVNDSLENSPLASFVYTVNPLPQAAAPSANPTTDASNPTRLANGERISLTTSTLNTDIYYTTDGSVPNYDARDAWDAAYAAAAPEDKGQNADGTRWYTDEAGVQQTEPATRIYDVQQGISMSATETQQFFTVTALAIDRDRVAPSSSVSEAVSYVYRLAQVEAPASSPETTSAQVAVVEPGTTIVLTSGTVGAKIYYTKDTTMPDLSDTDAVDKAYAEWYAGWSAAAESSRGTDAKGLRWYTVGSTRYSEPSTIPYDAAEGITMPKTITTFLTLRAVAVVTDGSRAASDVVTISYQPPAPVQAVYASPVDGSSVEYGTAVTLSCATEDAQIFYKVYTSAPADGDVPVVNKDLGYTEPISITQEVWIRAVAVRSNVESIVTTYHYTVAPTADAPTPSLPSGSVVPKGTRMELSGEGTVVYTLDGSDPKAADSEKLYGNTVNLDGSYGTTLTVRAYIQRDGYTPSDTVSLGYTICAEEDYLNISVDSGSVIADNTAVTLSTAITNGRIFYTLDGSTPQVTNVFSDGTGKNYTTYEWAAGSSSTVEGSGFTLSGTPDGTVTVRAIVVTNGGDGGQVKTFTYRFQPQAAAPTASIPTGAVVFDGATVTLTAKEGTIYYTTDGSTPSTSSAIYSTPIDVSGSATTVLRAMAVVENKAPSAVAEFRYTRAGQVAAPVFSVPSGEIDTGTTVTITSATQDAVIYYSTDGTEPTADNVKELTMYVAPITITRAVTIKAIAVSDKLDESTVQSATYTVRKPEPQPTENPDSEPVQNTVTDRLTSRRTYNSVDDGPSYSDVVLRESASNTVLSAQTGVVPEGALLSVKQVEPTRSDQTSVRSSLGQNIALVYEAQLTLDGDTVRPSGEVELGFAIPAEYQNGVVTVSRINDDGTLTQFTARRSGGMAYIKTSEMGRFALSVPQTEGAVSPIARILLWIGGVGAVLLGLFLLLWYRRRRREAEEPEPVSSDPEYQNLAEFFVGTDHTSTE